MKKKTDAKHFREHLPLYLMLLPGLAYLLINNYIPMAGIIIAFKKLNFAKGILGSPWAGLRTLNFCSTRRTHGSSRATRCCTMSLS